MPRFLERGWWGLCMFSCVELRPRTRGSSSGTEKEALSADFTDREGVKRGWCDLLHKYLYFKPLPLLIHFCIFFIFI